MTTVKITRTDPLANVGSGSHEQGILSVEEFETMALALESLRKRGIPITGEHVSAFESHPETQFARREFVQVGADAYDANVHYDVRFIYGDSK